MYRHVTFLSRGRGVEMTWTYPAVSLIGQANPIIYTVILNNHRGY